MAQCLHWINMSSASSYTSKFVSTAELYLNRSCFPFLRSVDSFPDHTPSQPLLSSKESKVHACTNLDKSPISAHARFRYNGHNPLRKFSEKLCSFSKLHSQCMVTPTRQRDCVQKINNCNIIAMEESYLCMKVVVGVDFEDV